MNTWLHAICDSQGHPISFSVTPGKVSGDIGAAALLGSLPQADFLLEERGCDADHFRNSLKYNGILPCIPGRKQ